MSGNPLVFADECRYLGFLRFCDRTVEFREPEEAIGDSLRHLALCLETGGCSKGVIISGIPGKVKYASPQVYYTALKDTLGSTGSGSYTIELNLLRSDTALKILLDRPSLYTMPLELVVDTLGIHLGVRTGNIVILPGIDELRKITIDSLPLDVFKAIPLSLILAPYIIKAYRRLIFSLSIPPPSMKKDCVKRASMIECYAYRGSARCVYDRKVVCPLRILYRKPPKRGIGGALYHVENGLSIAEKAWDEHSLQSITDKSVSAFILAYIGAMSVLSGIAHKKIIGIRDLSWEADKLCQFTGYIQKALSTAMKASPRLGHYMGILYKNLLELKGSNDPYKLRTRLLIMSDSMIHVVRRFASMSRLVSPRIACRPRQISPKIIEGYLRRFIPLLGPALSHSISERISQGLSLWGCIEASDLTDIIGVKMGERILEVLSEKNLLRIIPLPEGKVYVLR